jgi:hypothetical protein
MWPPTLPIKGFAQADYRRQFDLMPDGRRFLAVVFGLETEHSATEAR